LLNQGTNSERVGFEERNAGATGEAKGGNIVMEGEVPESLSAAAVQTAS